MRVSDPISEVRSSALVISLRGNVLRKQLLEDHSPINKKHNGLSKRSLGPLSYEIELHETNTTSLRMYCLAI